MTRTKKTYNVHEAKTHLSRLLERVADGDEVVIAKAGVPVARLVPEWMARTGVTPLPVLHRHTLHVSSLPIHHSDPFDRLFVAQAQLEELTILTADRNLGRYEVSVKLT